MQKISIVENSKITGERLVIRKNLKIASNPLIYKSLVAQNSLDNQNLFEVCFSTIPPAIRIQENRYPICDTTGNSTIIQDFYKVQSNPSRHSRFSVNLSNGETSIFFLNFHLAINAQLLTINGQLNKIQKDFRDFILRTDVKFSAVFYSNQYCR
jgi:hypothetical protein